MNTNLLIESGKRKQRITNRLRPIDWEDQESPMLSSTNIHYEIPEKSRGIALGGIGAIHMLANRVGLAAEINKRVRVLKKHLPYWESDHVLNIAYNVMCGGRSLEDIEHLRNDEVYMDSLGAQRIPDRRRYEVAVRPALYQAAASPRRRSGTRWASIRVWVTYNASRMRSVTRPKTSVTRLV